MSDAGLADLSGHGENPWPHSEQSLARPTLAASSSWNVAGETLLRPSADGELTAKDMGLTQSPPGDSEQH